MSNFEKKVTIGIVDGDVRITSPGLQPRDKPERCKAAVPFDTAHVYLEPKRKFKLSSKLSTDDPCVSHLFFRAFSTASISDLSIDCLP